jgi:hypothetical protein
MGENKKVKRAPAKVAWYFPIIPHLQRMFVNKANIELLLAHKRAEKDAMLHHPAEVRNIRFRLSTDGMNPFGKTDSSHSTWPVTLCIYNLPS